MRRPVLLALVAAMAASGCGNDNDSDAERADTGPKVEDPGPVHVHGLGINPKDGALFIATHTGLFRAPEGNQTARRVAGRYQDTKGFTVVGPDRFLGSGHPDGREGLPPFLGLIRSNDAGESWQPVSLMGESDFHVLEASGQRVYGFGTDFSTRREQLLVSSNRGRSWQRRPTPEPLISIAVSPTDPDTLLASGSRRLYRSRTAAQTWTPLPGPPGLLAWPHITQASLVAADGSVARSSDQGRSWKRRGDVGGQPAAFDGAGRDLYVALHDGTIKRSRNQGGTWSVRSRP